MNLDLFELKNAKDLFVEVQSAIVEYHRQPTSRLLLFLVFSLNHLREWITGSGYDSIMEKLNTKAVLTKEEHFFCNIWTIPEFKIINSLCNRSKHHVVSKGPSTSIRVGWTVNSPVSDSLGQVYYLIDGIDSREIFAPVIREYYHWFQTNG